MTCSIHFYGELGLVNACLLDLRQRSRLPDLLRRIEFVFRDPKHIDVPDDSEIVIIVEAGFADFGWPDAIIIANTPDHRRYVVFVEAKAGLYLAEPKLQHS